MLRRAVAFVGGEARALFSSGTAHPGYPQWRWIEEAGPGTMGKLIGACVLSRLPVVTPELTDFEKEFGKWR